MLITRSAGTRLVLLLLLAILASGCSIAGGIFKAGFWSGIIVVVLIVFGIVLFFNRARR